MTPSPPIAPPTKAGRAAYRRHFHPREKAELAREVIVTYVRARWSLSRRGIRETVLTLCAGPNPTSPPDGDQLLVGLRLGQVIGRTLGVLPADSRCLVRSLVLTGLLSRRGIRSTLVIGVKSRPKFEAHAWVECAGIPLLPSGDEEYARLVEI